MRIKSVGTFTVILVKLATSPLPRQRMLRHNIVAEEWVMKILKLSLGAECYVKITWKVFPSCPKFFWTPLKKCKQKPARFYDLKYWSRRSWTRVYRPVKLTNRRKTALWKEEHTCLNFYYWWCLKPRLRWDIKITCFILTFPLATRTLLPSVGVITGCN